MYSRPEATDRLGIDFDATGRLTVTVLEKLGVPREADFYVCGPRTFLEEFTAGLSAWGVAPDCIHTEIFGSGELHHAGCEEGAGPPTARTCRVARQRSKDFICSRRA